GRTLATDDPLATNADLLFQNSDIFFVDNVHEMCAISQDGDAYEATHKRSAIILQEMAKAEASVLTATFSRHPALRTRRRDRQISARQRAADRSQRVARCDAQLSGGRSQAQITGRAGGLPPRSTALCRPERDADRSGYGALGRDDCPVRDDSQARYRRPGYRCSRSSRL